MEYNHKHILWAFKIIRTIIVAFIFVGGALLGWFGLYKLIVCCGETNKNLVGVVLFLLITIGMASIIDNLLKFFERFIDNIAVGLAMKITSLFEGEK